MSIFRKKSTTSTDSSSSSSGSSSTSGSSSDSNSSSSDSDSSSSADGKKETAKIPAPPPVVTNAPLVAPTPLPPVVEEKSHVTTRRQSAESKLVSESSKPLAETTKATLPPVVETGTANALPTATSQSVNAKPHPPTTEKEAEFSTSKPEKETSATAEAVKPKASDNNVATPAPTSKPTENPTTSSTNKNATNKQNAIIPPTPVEEIKEEPKTKEAKESSQGTKKKENTALNFPLSECALEKIKEEVESQTETKDAEPHAAADSAKVAPLAAPKPKTKRKRAAAKPASTPTTTKQTRSRALSERVTAAKNTKSNAQDKPAKTTHESDSHSAGGEVSHHGSNESEGSESNHSTRSKRTKKTRSKRGPASTATEPLRSDTDDAHAAGATEVTPRKFTRSFNTRRCKQPQKAAINGTESESDPIDALEKRAISKSPAKKPTTGGPAGKSKCKVKKENGVILVQPKPRPPSPLVPTEKKCPVEGCDSSGHLSGNLDKHFLPDACPIYHNMTVNECKERAKERKRREEEDPIVEDEEEEDDYNTCFSLSSDTWSPTPEQREYLMKIREARQAFIPLSEAMYAEKIKKEKDCDDDREPSLVGLVPDYDLQMFREAQAIASEKVEDEVKELAVGKGIKYITMGKYRMKVWYQSPYPDDAARLPQMYICEFCLRYHKSDVGIKRHAGKCIWRHPPGDEIYRKGKLQVWQVDGRRRKQYCQNLCLLAKFFLDHKTLYYDVEPFLFYIMTLADVDGCHMVGYFSKEKNSFYNVSCILTLPPYQRKGYGRLLIDFSYLLTRVEGKIGSPEKPLSDLGLISYRSYWKDVLLEYLCNRQDNTLSIKDVSQEMAIYSYDIVSTLQALGMMKYWKGKHIVLKKQDVVDEYEERLKRRGNFPKIDETCLRWSPFVPTPPCYFP